MNYRIGLHLDIDSVGWAILQEDKEGQACRIMKIGVRTFPAAENPYNGAAPGVERRQYRLMRRRFARKRYRLQQLRRLFDAVGLIDQQSLRECCAEKGGNVADWRVRALDERLPAEQWARVLYYIGHHRGCRFEEDKAQSDSESKKIKKAVEYNRRKMQELHCRTVGELFARDERFCTDKTVFGTMQEQPYARCVSRSMIEQEAALLFAAQRRYGNPFAEESFEQAYLEVLCRQRSITDGPGENSPYALHGRRGIGKMCLLEPTETRAPAAHPVAERFRLLAAANAALLRNAAGESRLNDTQRQNLLAALQANQRLTDKRANEACNIPSDTSVCFVLDGEERSTESIWQWSNPRGTALREQAAAELGELDKTALEAAWDDIVEIFAETPPAKRADAIRWLGLSEELANRLNGLKAEGRAAYSLKAMQKLLPLMETGMPLEAAKETIYPTADAGRLSYRHFYEIVTPIVNRTFSQATKVLRAIMRQYGEPRRIQFSVEKRLGKSFAWRQKDKRVREAMRTLELEARITANGYLQRAVCDDDIRRLQLWQTQDGRCMYTGQEISLQQVFDARETTVDHILPYEDTYDDSFRNLVLVYRSATEDRRELPANQFSWDPSYTKRVYTLKDAYKRAHLLCTELTDRQKENMKIANRAARKRVCNRYERFLRSSLQRNGMEGGMISVCAVSNEVAGLRGDRLIPKMPQELLPAAQAAVTAVHDVNMCKKIAAFFAKNNYEPYEFPQPWNTFRGELQACGANGAPRWLSHMPCHSVGGAAHQSTLYRIRGKQLVTKKALKQLKLSAAGEIADYFQPERDRLLYNALKERLSRFGGNAALAFEEPFYKPKADGMPGPPVKSVPIVQRVRDYLPVRGGAGIKGGLVRLDIFHVKGDGYYQVPVYVSDTLKSELPDLAPIPSSTGNVKTMKPQDFVFSLYYGDLIYVKAEKPFMLIRKSDGQEVQTQEGLFYRGKVQVPHGSFAVVSFDRQYEKKGLGIKRLQSLEKCEVDVLGNVHRIHLPEKRVPYVKSK